MSNKAFLGISLVFLFALVVQYKNFCQIINGVTSPTIRNLMLIGLVVLAVMIGNKYRQLSSIEEGFNEDGAFEVHIRHPETDTVRRLDLVDFFEFVEYFQTNDLLPDAQLDYASCYANSEHVLIKNSILDMMDRLNFIVNVNEKDNFYSRFLINYVGSNLSYDTGHPYRRINYDEMVSGKISPQFTISPQNEFDKYYPRPNTDSKYQGMLPHTINIRNYFQDYNVKVNLVALSMMLELVQERNHDVFNKIVRPTEHTVFEEEFVSHLNAIKNDMLKILTTELYKTYLKEVKFKVKYQGIMHHPQMLMI